MVEFSSGTNLIYKRARRNSGRLITAADLFAKFNGTHCRRRPWEADVNTYLHAYISSGKTVEYSPIHSVRYIGRREMVCISTDVAEGNSTLGVSSYLRTRRGSVLITDVVPGIKVLTKGTMLPADGSGRNPRGTNGRVTIGSLHYYGGGWADNTTDPNTLVTYNYRRSHRARLVVEAHENDLSFEEYIQKLRTDPNAETLYRISDELEVHHIDGDCTNDILTNLRTVTRSEHALLHQCDQRRFRVSYYRWATVKSVTRVLRNSFDITLDGPNNVAAANGLFAFEQI